MYSFTWGGIRFHISVLFPAVFLILLYYDNATTLTAFLAVIIHEMGHILALLVCKHPPLDITLSAFGIRFGIGNSSKLCYMEEIIIAASGPIINIVCGALLYSHSPYATALHITLAAINLLPLYPLDGERIWRSLLSIFFYQHTVDRILRGVFWICFIAISALGVGVWWVSRYNATLFIVALYVGIQTLFLKGN